MSERLDLEEVRKRAHKPAFWLEHDGHPYGDEYTTALQESQEDVMKLVAEVEQLRRSQVTDVRPTTLEKLRALKLLWRLEEIIYDATGERPFSDFQIVYDQEDNRIYPDVPQTPAGFMALTEIWITMLGLDRPPRGGSDVGDPDSST